ncbi:class I SAM-dependent methyltransferase [Patescibacteria group bacterium]
MKTNETTPDHICRICGDMQGHRCYDVPEMMYGTKETFSYFSCGRCQTLQIVKLPKNLSKYYPKTYYSYQKDPASKYINPLIRWIREKRDNYAIFGTGTLGKYFYKRWPEVALHSLSEINLTYNSKILDVGSGQGALAYALENAGFTEVAGVDPFIEKTIKYPNGLVIHKKELKDIEGQWDLIMFHHSFEHLGNPLETLEQVKTKLKAGGTCLIRVPTVSSYAWKKYKTNWVALDAPRHLVIPSLMGVDIMAYKTGFEVDKIIFDSSAMQFWGSEQYKKDIALTAENSYAKNPSKSIFTSEKIQEYEQKAQELNEQKQGDSIAIYLKKS